MRYKDTMNRLSFIGQIICIDPVVAMHDIVSFFDHAMVMYEALGEDTPNIVEKYTDNYQSLMILNLQYSDQSKLDNLEGYVNNIIHNHKNLYGKSFNINTDVNGPCIKLSVQQES